MRLFRSRPDPIEARSRELADEIKRLEREIRQMGKPGAARADVAPKAGNPAAAAPMPPRPASPRPASGQDASPRPRMPGPRTPQAVATPPGGMDMLASPVGARKFDLPAAWRRWTDRFTGRNADSHRMAHYLAAGSFHGLRPLRYEKRVARNRFIGLFVLLVIVLTGLARVYVVNMR